MSEQLMLHFTPDEAILVIQLCQNRCGDSTISLAENKSLCRAMDKMERFLERADDKSQGG